MNNSGDPPFNNESNPPTSGSYWLASPSPPSSLPPQISYQFVNTPASAYPPSSASPSSPYVPALNAQSGFGPTPSASGAESSRSPNTALPQPKVQIPRITSINQIQSRRRSARACEPCRHRKIKCDGKKPTCGQCTYHKSRCVYEDVKRVRDEKQIKSLSAQVELYEKTLRSLEGEVDAPTSRKIKRILKRKEGYSEDAYDSSDSDSSVGSLEAVDVVGEDLNRSENARASGYFGKNSEISWIQKLEDNAHRNSTWDTLGRSAADFPKNYSDQAMRDIPLAAMNYHLDDLNIPALDKGSEPMAMPPRELADEYLNAYMTLVNPFFSAVRRSTFEDQYMKSLNQGVNPPRKWLAILNMIFAIGCRHCRMMNPDNNGVYDDDMVFLMRARQLSFNENTLFEHTTLQQIQLEFLVALYLLCVGQLNRASKLADLALHSAISLGVNLRLQDGHPYDGSKEARCRLWWSIYSLQYMLNSMHGRASSVGENLSTLHLPIPVEEESFDLPEIRHLLQDAEARDVDLCPLIFEKLTPRSVPPSWATDVQPSPSLFFHYLVDLSLISQSILNKVYSIEGIREGSTQTEYRIQKYSLRMDHWLAKLPPNYQFNVSGAGPWHLNHAHLDNEAVPHTRERVSLAMNYYSARITLCRPCLSLNYSRSTGTSVEKTTKAQLRAELATNCLQASCALISIFPEQADIAWLARVTPMWSALHFLMQSTTALLLGLSYCSFAPQDSMQIPSAAPSSRLSGNPYPALLETDLSTAFAMSKKAVGWMHTMASLDPAAKRACVLCDDVVRRIAPALKMDLSDWPSSASLDVDGDGEGEPDLRMDELDDLVNFETGSI